MARPSASERRILRVIGASVLEESKEEAGPDRVVPWTRIGGERSESGKSFRICVINCPNVAASASPCGNGGKICPVMAARPKVARSTDPRLARYAGTTGERVSLMVRYRSNRHERVIVKIKNGYSAQGTVETNSTQ